jgi:hypothetical protein
MSLSIEPFIGVSFGWFWLKEKFRNSCAIHCLVPLNGPLTTNVWFVLVSLLKPKSDSFI